MKTDHEIAYRLDAALWAKEVLGISPRTWQEEFLRVPLGQDVLVLTARQVGKTTAAACSHCAYSDLQTWIVIGGRVSGSAPKCRTDPQGQGNGSKSRRDTDH